MKVYKQRLRWFKGFIDNIWKYRKMMHPSYGNLGVFSGEYDGSGLWLNGINGHPDHFWYGSDRWVFLRRK